MGIEYLTVLLPTEVNSFDFQVESTGRTVQYKLTAPVSASLLSSRWCEWRASRWSASSPKQTNISNCVSFVVRGLSASSSSTTLSLICSSSSSQESVPENRDIENPVSERGGSASEELRRNPLHDSTATENKNKNKEREEEQIYIYYMNCRVGYRKSETLVDESSPINPRRNREHGCQNTSSSSHELSMQSRAKVEPGSSKHSFYTHFRRSQIVISAWRQKQPGFL